MGTVSTNKPNDGIEAYIWRMVRFFSGIDARMPMACDFHLAIGLERMTGAKVSMYGGDAYIFRECRKVCDELVDGVQKSLNLGNGGVMRWGRALGMIG
jgi:hypothetical protein